MALRERASDALLFVVLVLGVVAIFALVVGPPFQVAR